MPNPPQDDRLQDLWSELVKKDIDPDAVFEAAQKGASYGGLHQRQISAYIESILERTDPWEYFWICTGPSPIGDHHYQFIWSQVEWDDEQEAWTSGDSTFTDITPYEIPFQSHEEVPADEFHTWLKNRDPESLFDGAKLTHVSRDDVLTVSELLFDETPNTFDARMKALPDDVGEAYTVTWEVVDWEGNPADGYWKPR